MLGTYSPHHHHVGHHQKMFPSWHRSPQLSHRSLPNTKNDFRKFVEVSQPPENCTEEDATTAYFSQQPPVEPIKIALTGDFPNHAFQSQKIHQLVKNCRAINFFKNAVYGSHLYPGSKETTTIGADDKSAVVASSTIYSLADATRYSERESRKENKDVGQLIAELAVTSPTAVSEISVVSTCRSQASNPMVGHRRSSCSIAVQARVGDFRYSTSEDKLTSLGGEEWMGGVRALRDSHVRLVQRQLRHIERLNRALDRVVRNTKKHVHF
ncbi:hypothetical protein NE865_03082 [Phthorimaea operculella]|nr:hypothetical protein NE865_03082 [Phthorimaea operculella]